MSFLESKDIMFPDKFEDKRRLTFALILERPVMLEEEKRAVVLYVPNLRQPSIILRGETSITESSLVLGFLRGEEKGEDDMSPLGDWLDGLSEEDEEDEKEAE